MKNKILFLLPPDLQELVVKNAVTVPGLLDGTVNKDYTTYVPVMVSWLALGIFPYVSLSPLQSLTNFVGFQVFKSIQLFIANHDPAISGPSCLVYLIDKLCCHLDKKNSLSRRFIVAFKKKSSSSQVTGEIGSARQIADTMRQKIKDHGMVNILDHMHKNMCNPQKKRK